ncbi:hypothetical protein Ocin01_04199 [Orchesella cincta]|uniref:Uncharacterized protein n=1 Tax=Orchesella cincta TaxID=48709 RepID=A0A1D2NB53_ORCCI|nr:hypothetical protein Ocin01_04199 [Orchesella cincta]
MTISSDSDFNLSGRGSFRRFDNTDNDYHLFRQGSATSLTARNFQQGPNIPPQPLRPAPIPPSVTSVAGQLTSQSSLDSVFNTAPSSPANYGPVPRIPPPPPHATSSSLSHASPRSIMGDANGRGGGSSGVNGSNVGGASGGVSNLSSTNPFLPLLQASTQFFSQTIQSFQTGLQQPPATSDGSNGSIPLSDTSNNRAGGELFQQSSKPQGLFEGSTSTEYSSSSATDQLITAPSRSTVSSISSTVSTLPPASAGLSMGELLFSAPPIYQSKDLEAMISQSSSATSSSVQPTVVTTAATVTIASSASGSNSTSPFASQGAASPAPEFSSYLTKHQSTISPGGRPVVGPRLSTSGGSPQHTRYNLYHQNSAENVGSSAAVGTTAIPPSSHSPPPGAGSRRASYPNRKEYPHETIPKSEFPQHIPYIPSPHHHHRGSTGGMVERKAGMVTDFSDPLRHHFLPPTAATPVQPFLEEQEEPPEEPCRDHQLSSSAKPSLDLEREDLKNRIMLETMREEIRIANERMADATKSLMMDDVFLPTSATNNNTTSSDGNQHQAENSPRKQSIATGNLSPLSSTIQDSSISSYEKGVMSSAGEAKNSGISTTNVIFTGSNYPSAVTSSNSSLREGVVTKDNVVAGGALTSSGPLIHNNEPPICVNNRSNGASSSSSSSRAETETGNYSMQGRQEELIESDSKNGHRNERAVSTSSNAGDMNGAAGNHVSPYSTTSTERNEQQRVLKHQSYSTEITSVSALMNAMSSMGFNGIHKKQSRFHALTITPALTIRCKGTCCKHGLSILSNIFSSLYQVARSNVVTIGNPFLE